MSSFWSSFKDGIIGSILTQVGISAWMRVSIAFILCNEEGALGSSCLESSLLSVVMVKATIDAVRFNMSVSLVTRSDFVIT